MVGNPTILFEIWNNPYTVFVCVYQLFGSSKYLHLGGKKSIFVSSDIHRNNTLATKENRDKEMNWYLWWKPTHFRKEAHDT